MFVWLVLLFVFLRCVFLGVLGLVWFVGFLGFFWGGGVQVSLVSLFFFGFVCLFGDFFVVILGFF